MQIPEELLIDLGCEVLIDHGVDIGRVTYESGLDVESEDIILRAPITTEEADACNDDFGTRLFDEFDTHDINPKLNIRSGGNAN